MKEKKRKNEGEEETRERKKKRVVFQVVTSGFLDWTFFSLSTKK